LAEIELLRVAEQHPLFCPTLVRKGTIFGLAPRMRFDLVVNIFVLHAWRNRLLTVHGSGEVWRPLLHIRDAADCYIHLLWAPTGKIRSETFNLVHKNYRVLELAHWVAEILEQHRGVEVRVKRDRSRGDALRSYYVDGEKITKALGFRPDRGVAEAALEIWDALEQGEFGDEPENDLRYFNIRWLKEAFTKEGAI
jgi:nucleoside-diphosphate-sugar epimerase